MTFYGSLACSAHDIHCVSCTHVGFRLANMAVLPSRVGAKFRFVFAMYSNGLWLCLLVITNFNVDCLSEVPSETYDTLYAKGIESYTQQKWQDCSIYMSKALADFQYYNLNVAECRLRCNTLQYSTSDLKHSTDHEYKNTDLAFFQTFLKRSDCLRNCKELRFKGRPEEERPDIRQAFEEFNPYDYLQICAYKV